MQLNLDLVRRAVEPAFISMCQHVFAHVSIRQYLVRRAVEPVVAAVYSQEEWQQSTASIPVVAAVDSQEGCQPRERVVNLPRSLSGVSICTSGVSICQ